MYDLPELHWANDQLWAAIAVRLEAAGLNDVPQALDRQRPFDEVWTDPRLLLAQTCGYPFIKRLDGQVRLVATPHYGAQGCRGPFHSSAVIVRAGDPAHHLSDMKGATLALNDEGSGSGMNLLRAAIAPLANGQPFFGSVVVGGSHLESLRAIAAGEADVAAVDCVTWAHVRRLRPDLAGRLRALAWTDESPGLPLIAAKDVDDPTLAALRGALDDVARDPALAHVREALLLEGFSVLDEANYLATLRLEQRAIDLGYPRLC
jgi:ABC-type phosphate/phosphonate transport system substrate-binding protein